MGNNNKYLITLLGPTGIGKTELGVLLAETFNAEIISCDSRQMYKEMSIGTAVPSKEFLDKVPHHFIQHLSIHQYYNVSMFENDALQKLEELYTRHNMVLMIGGSGLYIDAVLSGIDDLPSIDPEVRNQLKELYQTHGIELLREKLKIADPDHYQKVDLNNPNRLLKALEVIQMTGKPYSGFLTQPEKERPFQNIKIGLNTDRQVIYNRINQRVDDMIDAGLINEAKQLLPFKGLNPLNTVGYKEIFEHFESKIGQDEAIANIKSNTRGYARRQLTWFRKYKDVTWFEPNKPEKVISFVKRRCL